MALQIPSNYCIKCTTCGASKNVVNVYRAILATKNINYIKIKSGGRKSLLVDEAIFDAVMQFAQMDGFGGMKLNKYLDMMFDRITVAAGSRYVPK